MNQTELHCAGFYMQYLHGLRDQLSGCLGVDVQQLTDMLSTFHVTEIHQPQKPNGTIERVTSQIAAVYTDLLSRGLPTLPSLLVEQTILKPCMDQGLAYDATDSKSGSIRFELPDHGGEVLGRWLEMLARAHVAVDARLLPDDMNAICFDSSAERDFFHHVLPKAIGNGPSQLFELQRPLPELLPVSQNQPFFDQKVDLAATAPGWQLVIEVDGPQHLLPAQKKIDQQRDAALRNNDWRVVRIPTSRLHSFSTQDVLRKQIPGNRFVQHTSRNFSSPLWQEPLGRLALQIVLSPFAIARVQHSILMALEAGYLSLSYTRWELVIVEQDVRAGVLAVVDFMEHLRAFYGLHKVTRRLPAINLLIYYTQEFAEIDTAIPAQKLSDLGIQVRNAELGIYTTHDQGSADLLIDVAMLQRSGYNGIDREFVDRHLSVSGTAYEVRSAYHSADTRRISPLDPITYPIEPTYFYTDTGHQRQEVDADSKEALVFFLRNIFRKTDFRDGQLPIIGRALRLEPVIGLLPTGAGKSLCYQIAALLQPGMTIVVDPLISLMVDQVDNLFNGVAIDWIGLISSLGVPAAKTQIADAMSEGKMKMLFLSPERLQNREFRLKLRECNIAYPIVYAVLDEAHCVSEWGHDFRTAYLRVAKTIKEYCRRPNSETAVIALTGTASFAVLSDVQREIEVDDERALIYPESFDRKELHYRVVQTPSNQKQQQLFDLMDNHLPSVFGATWAEIYKPNGGGTRAGIVFTPHANGDYGALNVSLMLNGRLNVPVKHFTGKTGGRQKETTQHEFKNNDFALLVATKAFGMGIDKPNVRYTIHYNIPPSLEAFYQETGRAGRDRESATCWLLFSDDRAKEADRALAPDADEAVIAQAVKNHGGDAHRLIWLHRNSFRGLNSELDEIKYVYAHYIAPALAVTPTGMAVNLSVPFGDADNNNKLQMRRDKAIYRLANLGLVQDYTLDYNKNIFEVTAIALADDQIIHNLQNFVRRYKTREVVEAVPVSIQAEPGQTVLCKCIAYLLRFVYEEIEKKRRVAIRSMLEVARKASSMHDHQQQDSYIRSELAAYLEKSPFTDVLLALARTINPVEWLGVLQMSDANGVLLLSTVDGVRQLIGGCRRTLESYLEHPGLLFLSSVGRLLLPDPDIDQAMDEARRSFRGVAAQNPQLAQSIIDNMLSGYQSILGGHASGQQLYPRVAAIALAENPTRSLARDLYAVIPRESERVIYNFILMDIQRLNTRLKQ